MQVRLEVEVAETLERLAARSGRTLDAEADAWLRCALRLDPGVPSVAAVRNGASPASVAAASGRMAPHWVGRVPTRRMV